MAIIRATCQTHNEDIKLTSGDVTVVEWDKNRTTRRFAYRYVCPLCDLIEYRNTEPHVANVLAAAGVKIQHIDSPIIDRGTGEPISEQDVKTFVDDLSKPDLPSAN